MSLFIFTLAVYGLTNIIVYSYIFTWLRDLADNISPHIGKLFSCMMCMSFWVGVVGIILFHYVLLLPMFLGGSILLNIFIMGIYSSGTTWLIHTIQEYFEKD